jgi:hypothetical protein
MNTNPYEVTKIMIGFAIGTRVEYVHEGESTGRFGTVVGEAIPARSAGGALMQRVKWDGPYARDEGSSEFVRRLVKVAGSSDSLPMPSVRMHSGRYQVLGTSRECIVERAVNGRWCLDVDGEFHKAFDTKREALVYCQDNIDL